MSLSRRPKHLNRMQYLALNRLGDAFIPGDKQFPSFSRLGCAEHVDRLLEYFHPKDRSDLKLLLSFLFFFPKFFMIPFLNSLKFLVNYLAPVRSLSRLTSIRVKITIFNLYYSGYKSDSYQDATPLDLMGYQVGVCTDD